MVIERIKSFKNAREAIDALMGLSHHLSESSSGASGTFIHRVGMGLLQVVQKAFLSKVGGKLGLDGITWKPLDEKTVAYRRSRDKRPSAQRTRARKRFRKRGKSEDVGMRPSLSDSQDTQWRRVYRQALRKLLRSLMPEEARERAAQYAWTVIKAQGGKTMLEMYGKEEHEILRDTGRMFNSFSYGHEDNIFEIQAGSVTVGSNVPYTMAHHEGTSSVPQRVILNMDVNRWDPELQEVLQDAMVEGILPVIQEALL